MNREEVKRQVLEKLSGKPKSIAWLQKEFKIGFSLAAEIYCEYNREKIG